MALDASLANLDILDVPVAFADEEFVVIRCNPAFQRIVGADVGDTLTKHIPEMFEKRAQRKLGKGQATLLGTGNGSRGPNAFEYRFRRIEDDGTAYWLVQGLDQTRMEAKEALLAGFTKTIELNNRRLVVQERAIADLLHTMKQAVFAVNKGGRICAPVSEHAKVVFGEDVTGKKITEILFGGESEGEDAPWRMVGSAAEDWKPIEPATYEYRRPGADEGQTLQVSLTPICHGDADAQKISKILFVVEDVTKIVALEAENAAQQAIVERQHASMKLILDNTEEGFLTAAASGELSPQASAACLAWFGPVRDGDTLWSYLCRNNSDLEFAFHMAWEQLQDAFLPPEVCLHQLPSQFDIQGQCFTAEYIPVHEPGQEVQYVVVIRDRTAEIARERAEQEQQDFLNVVSQAIKDAEHFRSFALECTRLFEGLCDAASQHTDVKRWLHTLKGNFGIWKLQSLATHCHSLEDRIEETRSIEEARLADLRDEWQRTLESVAFFLDAEDTTLSVSPEEFAQCLELALSTHGECEVTRSLSRLYSVPIEQSFTRLSREATALAERLGKAPLQVELLHNDLRVSRTETAGFFSSLCHVVRNAVDHGLLPSEARTPPGSTARIVFEATQQGEELTISVRNWGTTIDWDRLGTLARERNMPSSTQDDLVEALFCDGLSTQDEVSEVSGRGVGLAAVRACTLELGGRIDVTSDPKEGTAFTFTFPVDAVLAGPERVLAAISEGSFSRSQEPSSPVEA